MTENENHADPDAGHAQSVAEAAFDQETRTQLLNEDSEAWRSVTGLLLAIVVGGVMIAVFAVVISTIIDF